MSDKAEGTRKDDMETCKSGCTYSRSMDQVYPRKCIWCGKVEALKEKSENEVPSDENVAREIMKLEDQVCSLELAKKLKELGVKQESKFYWVHVPGKPYFLLNEGSTLVKAMDGRSYFDDGNATSAFTSSELGEILPHFAYSKKVLGDSFRWFCIFEKTPVGKEFLSEKSYEYAQTEADARAKMLINLIEKGIVKP